jgi:hypothetical protein
MADRHLTEDQKASLIKSLTPYQGHKITIASIFGDKEGKPFSAEFSEVFIKSGWTGAEDSHQGFYVTDPVGVRLYISKSDFDNKRIPSDYEIVRVALVAAKIPFISAYSPEVPVGSIQLTIGVKPPMPAAH